MSNLIIDEINYASVQIGQDGLSGTRYPRCRWEDWPAVVTGLMGTPVFFGGLFMLLGRQNWPGMPTLKVDNVTVKGMGATVASTWYAGPNYEFAELTVNYKVPKDEDDKNENGDAATYLVEELDYSVEIIQVPVQVVDQQDLAKLQKDADELFAEQAKRLPSSDEQGNPIPLPPKPIVQPQAVKKTVKRNIRIPTITYKTTIPRLVELPDKIQSHVGKINNRKIFGGAPGTVLFDGPSASRESAFFTQRFWKVDYQFIYQPHGWNNILHPDTLKWVPAKGVASDNDPYEHADLRKLYPKPYTVRG